VTQWILKRFWAGLVTLWVVMTLTFLLVRCLPGGPFDRERRVPPQVQANLEARYHLNAPVLLQYAYYLGNLLKGDLGPSYTYQFRSVNEMVGSGLWVSLKIGLIAMVLGLTAGILLGTLAGMAEEKWIDSLYALLGMASLSIPTFIFGGLLVLVCSLWLNILPTATLSTPSHYVLPVLSLSLVPFSYSFLLIRTAVKETKLLGFVRIKRCYGIPEERVTLFHVLRNSLLPLISILGPVAAAIVTGSFAVEYIFAIPGLGKYFVSAVTNRDYTLVMGVTLVYSVLLVVFNTLADVLYGLLEPRLRNIGEQEGSS
jgi:oligopeptide transport system permease protein